MGFEKAIKFAAWEKHYGKVYSHICSAHNCSNIMKISDFTLYHSDDNPYDLIPICNSCENPSDSITFSNYNNTSMKYNNHIYQPLIHNNNNTKYKWFCCFT